jgi:hypothetical protein
MTLARSTSSIAMKPHQILFAFIAASVSACGNSDHATAANPPGPKTFALQTVAGRVLPAMVGGGEATRVEIIADTIHLGADTHGRGTETLVTRTVNISSGTFELLREDRDFQYRIFRGRIEMDFACNDMPAGSPPACVAPPHYSGVFGDDVVSLDAALGYPTPMRFERIGE